jgi:hypothetical protein
MDSGCSNRVTKKRIKFINVDQEVQKKLQTTKGEPHDIQGKGTHIVSHNSNEIKIFNVLYVLILMKNLMSVNVLANINNIMVFSTSIVGS